MAEIITFFGPKARPSRATAKNIVEVSALKALLLSTMAGWRGAPAPLRLAAAFVLYRFFYGRLNRSRADAGPYGIAGFVASGTTPRTFGSPLRLLSAMRT